MLIVFQTNYTIPEGVVFTQTGFKAELSITSGKCNKVMFLSNVVGEVM